MKREILVDARGLEPPEPMERVLVALDLLRPGEQVRFLIHREPIPLYPLLDGQGYRHRTRCMEEGGYEVLIQPADGG